MGGYGNKKLIGGGGELWGEGFLFYRQADVLGGLDYEFAGDGRQDVCIQRGGAEGSAGYGEKGGGGAFGNQAGVADEYGLGAALSGGVGAGKDVGQEIEGFYVAPFPSQVGVR